MARHYVARTLARLWAAVLPWWGRLPIPVWLRWRIMWGLNQKFMVGVGAIILDEQCRVLLVKHTYRQGYAWGLPGGWLQRDEHPAQAVEREVREETGLEVAITRPLWVGAARPYPQLYITLLGRWVGGTFRSSAEVSEYGLFEVDAMPPILPDTAELIRQTVKDLRGREVVR